MEALRQLTTKKHDRGKNDAPKSYVIGSGAPPISKPLGSMTLDELVSTLPNLNTGAVVNHWIPALRVHIDSWRKFIEGAMENAIDNGVDSIELHNVSAPFLPQSCHL
jgi:hypothetical protein